MDILGLTGEDWGQIGISLAVVVGALVLTRPILNFSKIQSPG